MSDMVSREDAIRYLNKEYHGMISDESMKIYQIIEWLRSLPSVTSDAVSREVIEDIKEEIKNKLLSYMPSAGLDSDVNYGNRSGLMQALHIIDKYISGKENHETCN